MAIQNRRGQAVDFVPSKMLPGEFAVSLDNRKLYMCFASGTVKEVALTDDVTQAISAASTSLGGRIAVLESASTEQGATLLALVTRMGTDEAAIRSHDGRLVVLENDGTNIKARLSDVESETATLDELLTDMNMNMIMISNDVESLKTNAVRFDTVQNKSAAQKLQARENTDSAGIASLATAYSPSAKYAVGDMVTYGGKFYTCKTAITTAEAWNAAHWTEVTVGDQLSDLKDDLNNTVGVKSLAFENGVYYTPAAGNSTDITTPTPSSIAVCAKSEIVEGDVVHIRVGTGKSSNKAIAFVDANNVVLYRYPNNLPVEDDFVAPAGSAWVVINAFNDVSDYYAYIGPVIKISEKVSDIDKRLNTVSPEAYGAKGDGIVDDTAAWQSALNSGKKVVAQSTNYKCGTLTVTESTDIDCNNAAFTCTGTILFDCSGSESQAYNAPDYIANNAYRLTSPNTGYSGLVYMRGTNNIFKQRAGYLGGSLEWFKSGAMVGQIPIDVSSVSAYRISPIKVDIKNISNVIFESEGRTTIIKQRYCVGSKIENVNFNGTCYNVILFSRCNSCSYENSSFFCNQFGESGQYYYPVEINESTDIQINKINGYNKGWHCISTTGETLSRRTRVIDCNLITGGDLQAYFDHECGIETIIERSCLSSLGISVLSSVKDSTIIPTDTNLCVMMLHMCSVDGLATYTIDNCKFKPRSGAESNNGVFVYCASRDEGKTEPYYFDYLYMNNCRTINGSVPIKIKPSINATGTVQIKAIAVMNSDIGISELLSADEVVMFPAA